MDKLQALIDTEDLMTFTKVDDDDSKKITFSPPVYEQRYHRVVNLLDRYNNQMRHIVEFGCAEMKSFILMKNTLKSAKTTIDLVDIDGDLLEQFKNRVNPLTCDFLAKREEELTVNVWRGSVAVFNPNFVNVDAVIAIELIEHVFPDVLEEIPFVIFSQIHPKLVCVTTPNCEFNQLFGLAEGAFRHWDHKFEWTREQFRDWAENICARFPDYDVIFTGIGKPPHEHAQLGCVSQMAVFVRKDLQVDEDRIDEITNDEDVDELKDCPDYEVIHSVKYPFFKDLRSHQEKLIEEIEYLIRQFRYYSEYMNYDTDKIEIPVDHIINSCYKISEDHDEIRKAIKAQGHIIKDDHVILQNPDDEQDESDNNEDELDQ